MPSISTALGTSQTAKIGSAQSHSICYGGTLGHGYFRTSQTPRDKRKHKKFTDNYVDRVRFSENSLQDYKYPTRGFGWRHKKSISHLDLATSCHSTADGLGHWSNTCHLRHSRSLDYNHIYHCKTTLDDIAKFYWRIDPEAEIFEHDEYTALAPVIAEDQNTNSNKQNDNNFKSHSYANDSYHTTGTTHSQQQQQQKQEPPYQSSTIASVFQYDGETCSLRRSRSLAVIREKTFSNLQNTSGNSCRRRSQLIPRARLVDRGLFQEREKSIRNKSKHSYIHHLQFQKTNVLQNENHELNSSNEQYIPNTGSRCGSTNDSLSGGAISCDSHQYQHQHQNQHKQHLNYCHNDNRDSFCETTSTVDYYDNLRRLDAISSCFGEQLHPWNNDKSDLESLNSDYFKNSLHQNRELKKHFDIEALEEAVTLLTNDKPRIYQSRRHPLRSHIVERAYNTKRHKIGSISNSVFGDSCPENSQSSVFPETTTSNSDDQADSSSLSEQEYDLTKIEDIFKNNQHEDHDENNELKSLMTTHIHLETTEDEKKHEEYAEEKDEHKIVKITSQVNNDDSLKHTKAIRENLKKLIAYDSVYLSSEEGSESTLIENSSESFNEISFEAEIDDTTNLLHICIEDTIDEPHIKEDKIFTELNCDPYIRIRPDATTSTIIERSIKNTFDKADPATPLSTHVLKVEESRPEINISIPEVAATGVTFNERNSSAESASPLEISKCQPQISVDTHQCQKQQNNLIVSAISPLKHLKQQANELVHLPYLPRENAGDNQYHSLPDFNIGQNLKVSECIDAELRSSYNYNRCRCVSVDCHLQEDKTNILDTKTSQLSNQKKNNKTLKVRVGSVTIEKINNSIKVFGRTKQKSCQLEYKKLLKEKNFTLKNDQQYIKTQQTEEREKTEANKNKTTTAIDTNPISENPTLKPIPLRSVQAVSLEIKASNEQNNHIKGAAPVSSIGDSHYHSNITVGSSECQELLKEVPGIEVPNFRKDIFEQTQEIQECEKHCSVAFADAKFQLNQLEDKDNTKNESENIYDHHTFRIIVTDTQNNIIEEDSIDGNRGESTSEEADNISNPISSSEHSEASKSYENNITPNEKVKRPSLRQVPSKIRRQSHQLRQNLQQSSTAKHLHLHQTTNKTDTDVCAKSKEHRLLGTQIYKARPIRVVTTKESFFRSTNDKMPTSQILQVVENKRKTGIVNAFIAIKNARHEGENYQTENEFSKKVNEVRCYWSKLAKDNLSKQDPAVTQKSDIEELKESVQACVQTEKIKLENSENLSNRFPTQPERRHFILGEHEESKSKKNEETLPTTTPTKHTSPDDFCSFIPSIEIVELEGDKKATIVSAVPPKDSSNNRTALETDEPQFDHIRYKVLKSQQLLRNNLMPRTKKEAQFDGLIQYLQDYSFQELLSNNNVVIVEPVRTKIELPVSRKTESQENKKKTSAAQKVPQSSIPYTGALEGMGKASSSSGIRRHFFYQPVRVNRELYEEELPNPDTVRNARKFFEGYILRKPAHDLLVRNCDDKEKHNMPKKNYTKKRRDRKYRYLTTDMSYGHTQKQQHQHQKVGQVSHSPKWDTASLSSGISSGDLSSPCECNDVDTTKIHTNAQQQHSTSESDTLVSTSTANVQSQALKGVHVQNVVQQQKRDVELARTCPRSDLYKPPAGSSYYRDVYEFHIEQQHHHNKSNAAGGDNNKIMIHNLGFDEEIGENDEEFYDDEEENKFSDTHYVSNEVLQKIRECGSSVTYYGGRVLQSTKAIPFGSQIQQQTPTTATDNNRFHNIESCSVCQLEECPQKRQLQNNFQQRDIPKEFGIKFKLMKSNSCNSRLELASAEADERDTNAEESEVVKRIVTRFERSCQIKNTDNDLVTINNQTSLPQQKNKEYNGKKVTVNNHINMPQAISAAPGLKAELKTNKSVNNYDSESVNSITIDYDNVILENNETIKPADIDVMSKMSNTCPPNGKETLRKNGVVEEITFGAIENRNEGEKNGIGKDDENKNNRTNGTTKIIRNKNVDLAFTMAKQLQSKPDIIPKDVVMVSSTPFIRHEFDKKTINKNTGKVITTLPKHQGTNVIQNVSTLSRCQEFERNKISSHDVEKVYSKKKTQSKTTKPTEIIVPTSESIEEELCPSNSLIEKNIVRHYVANDKNLFERRRYDDIEFEQFEVYDPAVLKEAENEVESLANETRIDIDNGENRQQVCSKHAKSNDYGNMVKSKSPSCLSDMSSITMIVNSDEKSAKNWGRSRTPSTLK